MPPTFYKVVVAEVSQKEQVKISTTQGILLSKFV